MQRYATVLVGAGFILATALDNAPLLHTMTTIAIIMVLIHIWNDED